AGNSEAGFNLTDFESQWIKELAADLRDAGSRALVVAGTQQPAAVQQLAYAINSALGAVGTTVKLLPIPAEEAPAEAGIETLVKRLEAGRIQTLVILGGNPAYQLPRDLDWEGLQANVPEVIRVGYHEDETSAVKPVSKPGLVASHWYVPLAHFLES